MVLTRSQYKELGKVLISWEKTRRSREEKMSEADEETKGRLDAVEQQVASISSTLTELSEFLHKTVKKAEPSGQPKKTPDSEDEEDSDSEEEEDDSTTSLQQGGKGSFQNLKIDFKVEIPTYDGKIDVDKLDDWLERLETYFTLYGYTSREKITFATLKLSAHALSWWKSYRKHHDGKAVSWKKFKELLKKQFYPVGFLEERWFKWFGLRQKFNQSVQDYTTEFQNQAMALDIALKEYSVYMKYMAGLSDYIRKELKLFTVESIEEASAKAIAIEGKLKKYETKGDGKHSGSKPTGSYTKKEEQKKGKGESDGKSGLVCSNCNATGHTVDKCWEKYPHLKPKGLRRKEEKKKSALTTRDATEVPGMTEPNSKLNLMAGRQPETEDEDPREQLFIVKLQVKTSLVDAIVDPGSQKNLISEALVQKLRLKTVRHPKPYPLGWIQKEAGMSVVSQCTFRFALHESYIDEVTCDVVPLDVCQVILGNPYLWDRYAIYDRRAQTYLFTKDEQQFLICAISMSSKTSFVTANQAKQLVNACGKFVLLIVRPHDMPPSRVCLASLTVQQNQDVERLKLQFSDLFQDIEGLPPKRSVEHEIMLTGESSLPNVGLYRTTVQESDEIKRQVQDLLEKGVIVPSCSPGGSKILVVPKKDGG